MKELTFKVSSPKECSIVSLIKEVNKISCRIHIDIENGFITVENVNDTMIDNVIDLVDNYYTIIGVDIDNTFEETREANGVPFVTETTEDMVYEATEETVEVVTEKQPIVLEPQSEDDLIIKKVEFENQYVESRINNLIKTAYWALYNRRATEKDIGEYILTCMSEISMRYSSKPIIEFSIGDIVDVNYGSHLPGEIMGGHVHAIVCDILREEMAYVVPITKVRKDISSLSYLFMDAPNDATYNNEYYKGGTVLLDKGKYVRLERFNSVIGKVNAEFFHKILQQLASTFDFTDFLTETASEDDEIPFTMSDNSYEKLDAEAESENSEATVASEPTDTSVDSKISTDKIGSEEAALLDAIGNAFNNLDKTISASEQVEGFMNEINMQPAKLVSQSFIVACDIKKINYENVILELHNMNPNINEDIIKASLKEEFKKWLKKYPELVEKCPKISLMSVLKVFAKRLAQDNNC